MGACSPKRASWLLAIALSLFACTSWGADALTPDQAASHIGEQAEVCGRVASAKFANKTRGQPTFLNLGSPYPDHVFTALIWGSSRGAFSYPPESLAGKNICVRGVISSYRGKAQIIVEQPSQIASSAEP